MPPNRQRETVHELARAYEGCYIIGRDAYDDIECLTLDTAAADTSHETTIPAIDDDLLCAIVFTSGSTGKPTPNFKYWRTLREGTLANAALLQPDGDGPLSLVATVPPQHMWGFETSILLPLFCDIAVSEHTPFFPQDIYDALASLPEPRVLVSSPVHLEAFLQADVGPVTVQRVFSATAPMSVELAQGLEEQLGASVTEVFGCSESGIIATRSTASETLWTLSRVFELDVGEDRVLIRAAHLPEDVVLNDVIELVGDMQFRWLGRHQDMVNIAGKRGSLADLNHRLTSIPGVVDGVMFMPDKGKRLAALVVAPDMQPSDILERLRPGIEPAFLPRPLYIVSALPRQETGKLARKKVVELFEATRSSRQT